MTLNGTTVEGSVETEGNVNSTNATMESIEADGNINLINSNCTGKAEADGNITATSSRAKTLVADGSITATASIISGALKADGFITATRCEQIGQVHAEGRADISDCPAVGSVTVGKHVTLNRSTIRGDVTARGDATITRSQIGGTLTCTSNSLVIEESRVDTLVLNCSVPQMTRVTSTVQTDSTGRGFSSSSIVTAGHIDDDTVIDGIPFSQLKAAAQKKTSTSDGKTTGPVQKLILVNCVIKNIVFKGGNGEVTLSGTSRITGEVTGGRVKK